MPDQEVLDAEWHRANNALAAAETLVASGLPEDAVSRAYYAVLHAVRAALATQDVSAETHVRITAELITRRGEAAVLTAGAAVDTRFDGVEIADITPFVTITVRDHRGEQASTVVCAHLIGDLPGRMNEVIARHLDDPTKFLRFLALLLGIDEMSWPESARGQGRGGLWIAGDGSGVLELLLRGLADRPSQLDDLARVVESLASTERGRKALPDGFEELWSVVDEVRRDLVNAEATS